VEGQTVGVHTLHGVDGLPTDATLRVPVHLSPSAGLVTMFQISLTHLTLLRTWLVEDFGFKQDATEFHLNSGAYRDVETNLAT